MRPHTPEARHLIWGIWEPFGFVFMLLHSPWHVFFIKGIKCIYWEINHLWNKNEQKSGLSVPPVKEEKHSGKDGSWKEESYLQSCFSYYISYAAWQRDQRWIFFLFWDFMQLLHWNFFHFVPGTKKILVICLRFWSFRHDWFAWHSSVRAASPSWHRHVQCQGQN